MSLRLAGIVSDFGYPKATSAKTVSLHKHRFLILRAFLRRSFDSTVAAKMQGMRRRTLRTKSLFALEMLELTQSASQTGERSGDDPHQHFGGELAR